MIERRQFSYGLLATIGGCVLRGPHAFAQGSRNRPEKLERDISALEKERGGRLGVAVLDTSNEMSAAFRGDERFPMCSTFKLLAVTATLARVDGGKERLDRRIRFQAGDVVANSPLTKGHAGGDGMTLAEICEAAMIVSDNTAANLLLADMGGPAGVTAYARSLGDQVTRLDRGEPDLNQALPGDPRDTTSPKAMLSNLRTIVTGKILTPGSREHLVNWLIGNKTGDTRLRAGLPHEWRVGDKTGSGERGTTNDVGVVWPSSGRPPVFVAVYLTGSSPESEHRNATIAAVGRALSEFVS
ncbi:class A beta-lactamase [Bradyrhizobium sp.]|uniref:class A beta-lactamase n=1 Tax=Bradyrhizobium sp. TaxID=376 RepID=UPI00260EEAED|nr:class A beta-lactamase [Bradyrhizobium sp.]